MSHVSQNIQIPEPEPVDRDFEVWTLSVVSEWVDDFFQLVHAADSSSPEVAYALVSAWLRLWRTSPALIEKVTDVPLPETRHIDCDYWSMLLGAETFRHHEALLRRRFPQLVQLALQVARSKDWLVELLELAHAIVRDEQKAALLALGLFDDLDRTFLLGAAAEWALGAVPYNFAEQLRLAEQFLRSDSRAFVSVTEFAVACFRSVDFLQPVHAAIPKSVTWASVLIEELDRSYRFVAGEQPNVRQMIRAAWTPARSTYRQMRLRLSEFLERHRCEQGTSAPIALAAASYETQTVPLALRWVSPDRRELAIIDLPPQVPARLRLERLPLRFHKAVTVGSLPIPGPPVTDLQGTKARLCDIEAIIDEQGLQLFRQPRYATLYRQKRRWTWFFRPLLVKNGGV